MSADVFAGVYLCETDDDRDLSVIDKIREIIGEDYTVEGARISVQLKFGCAFSEGSIGPEDILKRSGNALAKVRRDDRKQVIRFKPEMGTALQRRRKLETELFKAIARDELSLAYQPLINLEDGSTFGAEALLRWESREFGTVSPFEFIPLAEENGYIVELGAWALNRGMKEARSWQERLRLSVNISPVQFSRGDLVGTVREALERTHFPAELLDLEVTESLFIDESEDLKFHMEELKSLGCSFSLDDFGTGYSSLGYVANYPFSKIKLDKSFVRQSLTSKRDIAIIEAVLHLANGFDMSVLVEGIETQEQARVLKSLGCPMGQGYLFGKPMSSTDFALLASKAA
jgi:EAL domain-containing protein (putative c-di-GMP-specific phosphodiesterase class I)